MLVLMSSCKRKWEYKVVRVEGVDTSKTVIRYRKEPVSPLVFEGIMGILNSMGKDGWELVTSFTEEETVYPNFGNEDYHTGIKTNTRTKAVNFVFKRRH